MITYAANGRTNSGYLSIPASGSGPGLIVLQEWWGLVGHIKDVADQFAAAGFVALAPDLYHGEATTNPDHAAKLLMALNIAEAGVDLRGAADYLLAHPAVVPRKVGALGFCMGGQLALYAAQEMPDAVSACVDYYGIHPKVEIVPSRVKVPVQLISGNEDRVNPIDKNAALLTKAMPAAKFDVLENTGHLPEVEKPDIVNRILREFFR